MASPASPRVGPGVGTVVLALLAAAVVGFLAGALLATTAGTRPAAPAPTAPATTGAAAPTASPTAQPPVSVSTLTLTADRSQADVRELIRLEGTLQPARAGVRLQVQQSVDGADFTDFPVTTTTRSDGSYGVWVRTGREGRNQFRTVTTIDGEVVASPGVVVDIR